MIVEAYYRSVDICLLFLQNVATDARTLNIARTLRKAGWRVMILGWGTADQQRQLQQEQIKARLWELRPNSRFLTQWLRFNAAVLSMMPSAAVYWAEDLYTLPLAVWLRYRQRADVVVYDARELYFALNSLKERPWVQRFWTAVERRSLPFVDGLLVSGDRDRQALGQQYSGITAQTLVLRNLPPYRMPQRTDWLQRWCGIPAQAPVAIYQGMLLPGRGIERFIAVLPLLPHWYFAIVGEGPLKRALQHLAEQHGVLSRCCFVDAVPYDELLHWTASAHVGIALIEPTTESYRLALPNKVFEYCQARIPVLATNLPAMAEVVQRYGIGLTVEPSASPETLAQAVQQLYHWQQDSVWQQQCHDAARQLSWEQQERSLVEWVHSLLPQIHSVS